MEIKFIARDNVQIDDARIIWRNFAGLASKFNREGDRNFAVVIPDQVYRIDADGREITIAEALQNDTNKYGAGWNVKIKDPREDGQDPLMVLTVKVKFTGRGPSIYLESGNKKIKLDEESVEMLDKIDIASVDLVIRPYDDMFNGKPFRSAYLESIWVVQQVDRFEARFAGEEYPQEY